MSEKKKSDDTTETLTSLSERDLEAIQGGDGLENRQQVHGVSSGYKGADRINGGKGSDTPV